MKAPLFALFAVVGSTIPCLSSILGAIRFVPREEQATIRCSSSSITCRTLPLMVQIHINNSSHYLDSVTPLPIQRNATHDVQDRPNRFWTNHRVIRKGCQAMETWQDEMHPTCLSFHEMNLNDFAGDKLRVVGKGHYRSVWMTREYDGASPIALKTLRWRTKQEEKYELLSVKSYEVGFTPRTIEQQRVDAVVLEQLSPSPHVAAIYGYCSTSTLVEYANGGANLEDFLYEKNKSQVERLAVAYDVAAAVADAHHVNTNGFATVAHTDLKPNQFLLIDGKYKLNDFNRAKVIPWNPIENKPCTIETEIAWKAKYQSPEEHRGIPQSEKVDVFTLGLILFQLYTRATNPFPGMDKYTRREFVKAGGVPKLPPNKKNKTPYDTAMRKAIQKCFTYDPKERPSAREIANLLHRALRLLDS